jgi:tRNA threonylcarbamoyladenosine biosynthesis protein TsaB
VSWLALDTATTRLSVAAGPDEAHAAERHVDGPRQHARALLPLVDEVLAAAGLTLARLEGLIVADGPGSFTGLRVGVTVAKALHHARGVPVWTAPSLLGCALAGGREAGEVLVTSEALRGDVYAAVYRFGGNAVESRAGPLVVARAEAAALAPAALVLHDVPVDARRLLALRELAGGLSQVEDVEQWIPVYGRPAEAQARWEREHGRPLSPSPGLAR